MSGEQHVQELRESQPNAAGPDGAAGGMGVSSERVGPTGDGAEPATDGQKDTSVRAADADPQPEQAPGNPEPQPEGIEPKAGFPSLDPRSEEHRYQPSDERGQEPGGRG